MTGADGDPISTIPIHCQACGEHYELIPAEWFTNELHCRKIWGRDECGGDLVAGSALSELRYMEPADAE